MTPHPVMVGSHDYGIVALSILVSVLAAYAALELAERMNAARGSARRLWLLAGGAASGIGTWSMHYTAMLGFSLPVAALYHWPTVVGSFLPAALSAAGALFLVSPGKRPSRRTVAGAILMGGGIAALHYTAMGAMRLPGIHRYAPGVVALSVVVPMVISLIPLQLSFFFERETAWLRLRKLASVVLLGATNPAMHYTGMAAVTFAPADGPVDVTNAVSIASVGAVSITIVPLMVIVVALVTSLVDRLREQRALLEDLFEQAPQAVAIMGVDGRIVRVNREFTRLFGYAAHEAVGRHVRDLIVPAEALDEERELAERVARGERVDAEAVRRRKDGGLVSVSIVRVPVSLAGGRVAVYGMYGDITRRKRAEAMLQTFSQQLIATQEAERRRVARELHDAVGQALAAIKLNLQNVQRAADAASLAQPLNESVEITDRAMRHVRELALDLRPSLLDDLGLVAALHWYVDREAKRARLNADVVIGAIDTRLPPEVETACFRITQEALTNVVRHARASHVRVELVCEDAELRLSIRDDGIGFDVRAARTRQGPETNLGLTGMLERAVIVGGEVEIVSAHGAGTEVRARFTLTPLA
jgi:PAS domain S-box-containing protein